MPTKRTKRERHQRVRVNEEARAAWRKGERLELHRALKLKPWECSPLDADGDEPDGGNAYMASIEHARTLRRTLIEEAG